MEATSLRKALPWIGTHLIALAAGVWFFKPPAGTGQMGKTGEDPAAVEQPEHGSAGVAGKAPARATHDPSPASVHKLAWKALAYENLDRPERLAASKQILKPWIKEDWQAALDTVMKETPDDYQLLIHFDELIRNQPGAVWAVIESKRYGVSTVSLKARWLGALRGLDETKRREIAAGLPEAARKEIEEPIKGG